MAHIDLRPPQVKGGQLRNWRVFAFLAVVVALLALGGLYYQRTLTEIRSLEAQIAQGREEIASLKPLEQTRDRADQLDEQVKAKEQTITNLKGVTWAPVLHELARIYPIDSMISDFTAPTDTQLTLHGTMGDLGSLSHFLAALQWATYFRSGDLVYARPGGATPDDPTLTVEINAYIKPEFKVEGGGAKP